jgi:hypothetical protein
MAERAELMGGRLEVTSRVGLGTTVTAVMPSSPPVCGPGSGPAGLTELGRGRPRQPAAYDPARAA